MTRHFRSRGAALHVWINVRHGRGMAWARHAICESALIVLPRRNRPKWSTGSSLSKLHNHTQSRHTTLGRTHLDEWSTLLRDLCLSTHNSYKRRTSTLPVGLEPSIPWSEWPPIHALDCAATGIGTWCSIDRYFGRFSGWLINLTERISTYSLWNRQFYYRVYRSPPLVPIPSQMNPVHAATVYLFKTHFSTGCTT